VSQFLALSGTVHPTRRVTGLGEKDAVTLGNNLEVTLTGLSRGGRRSLVSLLLKHLESCVNDASWEEARTNTYLLEDLHLARGLTIFALLGPGLSHSVANSDQLSINIFQASSDTILDRLPYLLLNETRGEWLQSLVQEIVLRIPDRELERSYLGVNGFDLEHRRVVLGRRYECNGDGDTLTTENEVGETRVFELRKTSLLPEVEGNVTNIRLNLAESEFDLVFGVVGNDAVRRESEVVPRGHGDDIGE